MLEKYKNWLIINGASSSTIKNYLSRITKVLDKISIEELSEDNLINYLLNIKQTQSKSTFNGYRHTIKSFLTFLNKNIKLPQALKNNSKLPEFITEDYFIKEILPVVDEIFINPLQVKTLLYFMFYTGLRISEVTQLTRNNINLTERTAKIYMQKTDKELMIIFSQEVADWLKKYFLLEPEISNAFNLNRSNLEKKFQTINKYLPDINFHPHIMRHSFATHFLNNGGNIRYLKELLGHASIETTAKYAHVITKKIKEVYDKVMQKGRG